MPVHVRCTFRHSYLSLVHHYNLILHTDRLRRARARSTATVGTLTMFLLTQCGHDADVEKVKCSTFRTVLLTRTLQHDEYVLKKYAHAMPPRSEVLEYKKQAIGLLATVVSDPHHRFSSLSVCVIVDVLDRGTFIRLRTLILSYVLYTGFTLYVSSCREA